MVTSQLYKAWLLHNCKMSFTIVKAWAELDMIITQQFSEFNKLGDIITSFSMGQ